MKLLRIKFLQWALIALVLIPPNSFGESSHRALVVIDMQPYFITRGGNAGTLANKKKVEEILRVQTEAILEAKRTNTPIIFLEYLSEGTTNAKLKDAAKGAKDVVYFVKSTDGMLDEGNINRKALLDYINRNKINTLIITGANGGACVKASITGALDNNLSVIAYDEAIADFNYQDFLYPYKNYYEQIQPSCKSCTFRETSDLTDSFSPNTGKIRKQDVQKILKKSDEVCKKLDKMSSPKGCGI